MGTDDGAGALRPAPEMIANEFAERSASTRRGGSSEGALLLLLLTRGNGVMLPRMAAGTSIAEARWGDDWES